MQNGSDAVISAVMNNSDYLKDNSQADTRMIESLSNHYNNKINISSPKVINRVPYDVFKPVQVQDMDDMKQ